MVMEFKLEDWIPQEPWQGPPLPEFMGIYWPWYKPAVTDFKVSNLVVSPAEVNPGQVVTITCTVTNIGTKVGDYTIHLGGDFVAEKTVTLMPGESMTVSFQVTPTVAKIYSITVDSLTGSFKATTVPIADIRVENLVISPTEVQVGQTVTISVTAKNYGTASGSKVIKCTVT